MSKVEKTAYITETQQQAIEEREINFSHIVRKAVDKELEK